MANTWGTIVDTQVVGSDDQITLTFSFGGSATDISTWTFTYRAEALNAWTADVVDVADGAMTKSDSGTGTTDRLTIPISAAASAVDAGIYTQEILAVISSERIPLFRGTRRFIEKVVA